MDITSADPSLLKLAFSRLHGMNATLGHNILARSGYDLARFFAMSPTQLAMTMGFESKLFSEEERSRVIDDARREIRFIEANNIHTLFFADDGYPRRLAECQDAPAMLFSLGECDLDSAYIVGVVGTRHATAYGTDFTTKLINSLAATLETPPVIVSGLAYGIDIAAHRAALAAGVPTVAVLAHGLNTIYPAAHREAAAKIVRDGGALVTEYAAADSVHRGNFLARNRIVAGLCDCVVVVESDIKGGAMVTARLAGDYNREVCALPGRVSDRYSRGCNRLISTHMAHLLPDPDALPDLMGWKRKSVEALQQSLFAELSPLEQQVVDLIGREGEMRLSDLQLALNQQTHRLMALLIDMELRGLVLSIPGNRYRLA